jgi:periplasmic divalent cation tolerance protein
VDTLVAVSDYVQVSTATATRDEAFALAQSAVATRLAGNAQIVGPVGSVFWHLGELGNGEEWQLLLYTTTARYPELEAHLTAHHPWDNPQITAIPLAAGAAGCLRWLEESVSEPA